MVFEDIQKFKEKGKIGVIGGSGRMGRWALNLFRTLGYKNLYFSDREDCKSACKEIKAEFISSNPKLAEFCDFVIISVPISETLKVIDEIGPYMRKEAILSDFTSVKSESCKKMAKYSKKAIGIHPMFKDSVKNLKNKNLVLTPTNPKEQKIEIEFLKRMFEESNLKVRVLSPESHDKITSFNQAGVHLMFLTYGNLLKSYCRKNKLSLSDLEMLDTPNSQLMNLLLGRFLATRNYEVMWGIQNSTRESKEIRGLFLENARKMVEVLDKGEHEQFTNDLEAIARKFRKARLLIESKDSDRLIDNLRDFGVESHFEAILSQLEATLEKIEKCLDEAGVFRIQEEAKQVIEKVEDIFSTFKENFSLQKYKTAADDALVLMRYIDKTVLKGKRRLCNPIRKNSQKYEEVKGLLDDFINKSRELLRIRKLIDVGNTKSSST